MAFSVSQGGRTFLLRNKKWAFIQYNEDASAGMELFDMENDATEDVNLASQYPEIVEELKKNLATIIKEGRSNPGKNQPTDLHTSNLKWPQIKVVEEYLENY